MDATELTEKNLAIAEEFTNHVSEFAEGVLLSGSNAWGANYAVTESSDIDLIVVVNNVEDIGKAINEYITNGLVDELQTKRFVIFKKLHVKNKVEIFSFRVSYKDTWVGIDFFTEEVVNKIINLESIGVVANGSATFRTLREFRSNPPKQDGYFADSLISSKNLIYHPKFVEIEGSYISNTLVDGQDGEYLMGVYSFFFAVEPKILLGDHIIINKVAILQSNIIKQLEGKTPLYITRHERMDTETLIRIKKLFSPK